MALARAHRLSLRFERERLTKTGKTVYGRFFTLISVKIPEDRDKKIPRFAIIVSKKTSPLAVGRNKIKRIVSTTIESILSSVPAKDYLVIPKKQILTEDKKTIKEDLKTLFSK